MRLVRQHRVPVFALHPQQQLVAGDAGVVDQHVEAPEALASVVDERVDRLGVGDVEPTRGARPPAAVISSAAPRRLTTRGEHHGRASAGERQGDRPADAARRAGDEGHLAGEIEPHDCCEVSRLHRGELLQSGAPKLTT